MNVFSLKNKFMSEVFINYLSLLFRFLPTFRGKTTIGLWLQHCLIKNENWKNPEQFITLKDGSKIFMDVRSEGLQPAFWTGLYDTALIKKFTAQFGSDWVVLDVGANTGWYTLPFARVLTEGKVHAFEPLSSNFNGLCKSIKLSLLKNIEVHQIGLGKENSQKKIHLAEKGNTGNAVILNQKMLDEGFSPSEIIKIHTLDTYFKVPLQRCDFIKMDIEGFEVFLLNGASKFISKHRPIMYGEFSELYMCKYDLNFNEIWNFCIKFDYKMYHQPNRFQNIIFFEVVNDSKHYEDLLLIPIELPIEKVNAWIN
jgi:FkbM family methyltransferase